MWDDTVFTIQLQSLAKRLILFKAEVFHILVTLQPLILMYFIGIFIVFSKHKVTSKTARVLDVQWQTTG